MRIPVTLCLALSLASCGQFSPAEQGQHTGNHNRLRTLMVAPSVPMDELSIKLSGGYTFVTTWSVMDQLQEVGLTFPVPDRVPEWSKPLIGADGRFVPGAFTAGEPIDVSSPVMPVSAVNSEALSFDEIAQFGGAVLVPLLLKDGRTAGLARVPLFRNAAPDPESMEFVLLTEPVWRLTSQYDAAEQSGYAGKTTYVSSDRLQPNWEFVEPTYENPPTVFAVAVGRDGASYAPFDVHWAVIPPSAQESDSVTIALVPLGLGTFITARGDEVKADQGAVSYISAFGVVAPAAAHAHHEYLAPADTDAAARLGFIKRITQ